MRQAFQLFIPVISPFQVTQEVAQILETKGYTLTCRGTIRVKGKGDMVTYFLEDRPSASTLNNIQNNVHTILDGKPALL
jgi:hypothetical protein